MAGRRKKKKMKNEVTIHAFRARGKIATGKLCS